MGNAAKLSALLALAGVMASGTAQATLHDRGGGLLYDDVLKVTWLQDADYAKTSGYDADGIMNWNAAKAWAANLVYHDSVRGVDWSDWRLARIGPVGTDWNRNWSNDGSTDYSFNITSPNSELAYMYYVNLGLKAYLSPSGDHQPDFGVFRDGTYGGQADVGPVRNLQSDAYWSGTPDVLYPTGLAWAFFPNDGLQVDIFTYLELHAWAVRDGDVAPVPEPETYAMFLAGLAVMGGALRRAGKAG